MTVNGNYDAGRVSNPFLNGTGTTALSRTDNNKIEVFSSGVQKTGENPWGVKLTSKETPETRATEVVATAGAVLGGMQERADYDANVTEFFAPYVMGNPTETAFHIADSGVWNLFDPNNFA